MRTTTAVHTLACLLGASLLGAPAVIAQGNPDREHFRLELPPGYLSPRLTPRALPALNGSTPSAYGPAWGDLFVGAGYQARTRPAPGSTSLGDDDGAVVAGFGLGNARRLGLEVAVTSFSTVRSGFFTRTSVSLKLHHVFPSGLAVAAGRESAVLLGETGDGGRSSYLAASKLLFRGTDPGAFLSAIGVTVGAGTGRFRSPSAIATDRTTGGVFGAVSVRLAEPVGAVADWNGQDLTLSASFVPLRCAHLILTPGVTDITHHAGSPARFILGVGLGERFNDSSRGSKTSCF